MNEIIVLTTVIGNVFLGLLLIGRGWSGRLQWFTITTILAVLVDCAFHWIHGFAHSLYAPSRIALQYWTFPALEAVCAWEAYCVGLEWLEKLMLIQVGLAIVAGAAHVHGDPMAIYRIEIFNTWFNILGIMCCILRLKGEPLYYERT